MNINENAPVLQRDQLFIRASPERVWAVLTDINRWTAWNSKITKAAMDERPADGVRFNWTVNSARIKSVLHTVQAPLAFGWSGTTFGGSAIHNWTLEPENGGTRVRVEESMEGWLISLFRKKMNRDLAKDMRAWLESLKRESER